MWESEFWKIFFVLSVCRGLYRHQSQTHGLDVTPAREFPSWKNVATASKRVVETKSLSYFFLKLCVIFKAIISTLQNCDSFFSDWNNHLHLSCIFKLQLAYWFQQRLVPLQSNHQDENTKVKLFIEKVDIKILRSCAARTAVARNAWQMVLEMMALGWSLRYRQHQWLSWMEIWRSHWRRAAFSAAVGISSAQSVRFPKRTWRNARSWRHLCGLVRPPISVLLNSWVS